MKAQFGGEFLVYTRKEKRTKGIEIHFHDKRPLPHFMVESASAEHPGQVET
jgi:hypothetical protein